MPTLSRPEGPPIVPAFLAKTALSLAVVGALILGACAGPRSSELQRLQFADVPVPAKFRLWPDSYAYEDSSTRVGRFDYSGDLAASEVLKFYKRTMPAYGWSLRGSGTEGASKLRFGKGQAICIVEVDEKGDRTHLHVDVEGLVEAP